MRSKDRHTGFTLIEVMVALAIVVVAFAAMFGSLNQIVASVTLMQDKTLATWIAFDRITELRVSDEFPSDNDSSDEIEMAGLEWSYTIEIVPTQSEDIRQVIVRVALADDPDNILGIASGALVRPIVGTNVPGGVPGGGGGVTR